MDIIHILAKAVIYSLFAFAFYTWNRIRIITDFNKRAMFYLIILLAGLFLVIYADFIENLSNVIKSHYFQFANYSIIFFLVVFSWLKKKKDNMEVPFLKPGIVLLTLWFIFILYQTFFMGK